MHSCKKRKEKKVISVLKSPHVNKKAQEHFEFRNFSNQFLLFFHNTPKCFTILKTIKAKLFPEVKVKLKFFIANKNSLKFKLKVFNPSNYVLNIYKLPFTSQKIFKFLSLKKMHIYFINECLLKNKKMTVRKLKEFFMLKFSFNVSDANIVCVMKKIKHNLKKIRFISKIYDKKILNLQFIKKNKNYLKIFDDFGDLHLQS